MVELITTARADLAAEGWDNGALSIFYRLLREGVQPPVWRTIHRVLVRQGLVVPQPRKRPRSSTAASSSLPRMIAGRLMGSATSLPTGSRW